jgi:hypothetical protein
MADAAIITKQNAFRKIEQASVPATYAAAAAVVTSTRPATNLVWDWQTATGNGSPSLLHLFPFSSINNGTTVGMRLIGWRGYADTNGTDTWWLPTVLQTFLLQYTSGTVPSATIDGAQRFSSTESPGVPSLRLRPLTSSARVASLRRRSSRAACCLTPSAANS